MDTQESCLDSVKNKMLGNEVEEWIAFDIYIYIYIYGKCYIHNIFTTNHQWHVVISRQKSNFNNKFNYDFLGYSINRFH